MTTIIFITHKGIEHIVDAAEGQNLMQAATLNGIPGIDADCGGACTCGTCQILVDPAWQDKIAAASAEETAMLDFVNEPQENSRLSCQIMVTEALSGLIVRLPKSQQ